MSEIWGFVFGRAYFFLWGWGVGGGAGAYYRNFGVLKHLRTVSYFICGQCLLNIFIIDGRFM